MSSSPTTRSVRLRLAWRDLTSNRMRHAVSALGIALAVAVVVGAVGSRATVEASLSGAEAAAAGNADLVAAPLGGLDIRTDDRAAEALRRLPGVVEVVGVSKFKAQATNGDARESLDLYLAEPVDLDEEHGVRLADGRVPASAAEVAVSGKAAERLGVRLGDRLTLANDGEVAAEVVGILADEGVGALEQGMSGAGSMALARALDGDRAGYTDLLVRLTPGTDATEWLRANGAATPAGTTFLRRNDLLAELRFFGNAMSTGIDLLAIATTLMGALLCFHINQVAAAARRRQTALLRLVGATRGDVVTVDTMTSALTTVAGTIVGVLLGSSAGSAMGPIVASILGVSPSAADPPAAAYVIAAGTALVLGAVAPLAGANWRTTPLEALAARHDDAARGHASTLVAAVAVAVTAVAVFSVTSTNVLMITSIGLIVTSVWLLRNLLVSWGRRARHRRGQGPIPLLATRSIARDARLVGVSGGLIMVILGLILATAVAHEATGRSVDDMLAREIGHDVQIWGARPLPTGSLERARAIPGVTGATALRFGDLRAPQSAAPFQPVPVMAIDPASYFDVTTFDVHEGDPTEARTALATGGVVVLDGTTADITGARLGDTLALAGSGEPVTLRVVAIINSTFVDAAIVGEADAPALGLTAIQSVMADVEPGTDEAVRSAFERQWPGSEAVRTARLRAEFRDELLSLFNVAYGSLISSALLCALGLGASMRASVTRRTNEFRLLRSLGTARRQVSGIVMLETTLLVALGMVAALPLGWALARSLIATFEASAGLVIEPRFPWALLPWYPLWILPIAVVAAVLPARSAAKVSLAER